MQVTANDEIYVAHMAPLRQDSPSRGPEVSVTGISVRYSLQTATAANVGSAVKTFEIVNKGNVPCEGKPPCSPGMQWKAAIGSATLDAGEGKEFRSARLSCIAGPCPFTTIDSDNFSKGGRTISASIRNWSDTTTFLLEADVFRRQVADVIRQSYPVIINQAMNFTLPSLAEGPSIEAKIDGSVDADSHVDGRVVIEAGAKVVNSRIRGPVVIGSDTTIVNSYVGPFTSIAAGCEIRDSELDQSVVLEGSRIVGVAPITDSLIGRNVEVLRTGQRPRALRLLVGDHSTIELE